MNQYEQALWMLRGLIGSMPKEAQDRVSEIADQLREIAKEPVGQMAIGLVCTELQMENAKDD